MVQISFSVVATIAALISGVVADNCRTQYTYCGSSLLGMGQFPFSSSRDNQEGLNSNSTSKPAGNYREQIIGALMSKGRGFAEIDIQESLFRCKGGPNGDIEFITFCRGSSGCWNRGRGYNDECFS